MSINYRQAGVGALLFVAVVFALAFLNHNNRPSQISHILNQRLSDLKLNNNDIQPSKNNGAILSLNTTKAQQLTNSLQTKACVFTIGCDEQTVSKIDGVNIYVSNHTYRLAECATTSVRDLHHVEKLMLCSTNEARVFYATQSIFLLGPSSDGHTHAWQLY